MPKNNDSIKKPFTEFHLAAVKYNGEMGVNGLCERFTDENFKEVNPKAAKVFNDFKPTYAEFMYVTGNHAFWASGHRKFRLYGRYTPLRQTCVLLCAAINGEFD